MADDPNQPVVLATVPTEAEAAMIAAALENEGVSAHTAGGLLSTLYPGASEGVDILVRQDDLERAREALRNIESGSDPESQRP